MICFVGGLGLLDLDGWFGAVVWCWLLLGCDCCLVVLDVLDLCGIV